MKTKVFVKAIITIFIVMFTPTITAQTSTRTIKEGNYRREYEDRRGKIVLLLYCKRFIQ